MSETELRFTVPENAARAVDASLRRLGGRQVSIESRYVDTADGRLARAAISLRLRRSRGRWEQTVKTAGRHAADRLEETVPRPGRWDASGPPVDPSLHAGTRAGALLAAALRSETRAPLALAPMCTSRVVRRAVEIEIGASRIEVAFDRGTIVAGDRSMPICEVEYELKAGDAAALVEVARAGIVAHAMHLCTLSKSTRGEALARHAGRCAAVRARPPELVRTMAPAALRRAILNACIDQVVANASILAAGQCDDEVVHQLRVGLRRLRTAVRELSGAAGPSMPIWDVAITDLFHRLGMYRDRSLVAESVRLDLAAAGSPVPDVLPRVDNDCIDPVQLIRGTAVQLALLEVVAEVVASPEDDAGSAADDARDTAGLAAHLSSLHDAVRKAGKRFAHIDDVERHRVRKRLKRLRYLAELVGPLYDGKAVELYLAKLRPAQDALGGYIDLIVAIGFGRDAVRAGDERAWFNVGWLSAQLPRGVKRCGKALARAATATPFWRR